MNLSSAPAKIILLGEHAVVYGQPAIAVPFPALRAAAAASPAPAGSGLTIIAHDVGRVLRVHPNNDTPDNALTYAAQLALRALNVAMPDLTIDLRSTIPIGSGFGSGAAVTTALIRALSAAVGASLDNATLNQLVYAVEKMHHGTPSGIDNTVIVHNAPIYFVRGEPPQPFRVGGTLPFLVADSGVSALTRETVGDVRRLVERDPETYSAVIARIGDVVREARAYIEEGNLIGIGECMNQDHELLRALTVSSDLLDRLTEAAREAGALGAKLTGGGRGGNVIVLVEPENASRVTAALRAAGAARLWPMTLEATA
jgi:mevalonate kinase